LFAGELVCPANENKSQLTRDLTTNGCLSRCGEDMNLTLVVQLFLAHKKV
jgi:hypothetical protein